jgi:hypothetical protein
MLFRTIEHYDDNQIINNNEEPLDCFICYEAKSEEGTETIKLKSHNDYLKNCLCDGWVHRNCLNNWYEKSNRCPICRQFITKNTKTSFYIVFFKIFYKIFYLNIFNDFVIIYIKNIFKFISYLLFIYYTYNFYLIISNKFLITNDEEFEDCFEYLNITNF